MEVPKRFRTCPRTCPASPDRCGETSRTCPASRVRTRRWSKRCDGGSYGETSISGNLEGTCRHPSTSFVEPASRGEERQCRSNLQFRGGSEGSCLSPGGRSHDRQPQRARYHQQLWKTSDVFV